MERPEGIPGGKISERNAFVDLIVVSAVVASVLTQFARQLVGVENGGVEDGFLIVIDPLYAEFSQFCSPGA